MIFDALIFAVRHVKQACLVNFKKAFDTMGRENSKHLNLNAANYLLC